jgi:hypothetical protein
MLSRKKKAVVAASLLLAICIFLSFSSVFFHSVPSRPGEGYMNPSSGIHITPAGDIIDSAGTSSNINIIIHRDGNTYTLMGNITSPVTIEKSNVRFDGQGFSFVGSHGLILLGISNVTVKDLNLETHYLQLMRKNAQNNVVQKRYIILPDSSVIFG